MNIAGRLSTTFLKKPFFFVSCDTIWLNNIKFNTNKNWIMVNKVTTSNLKDYMNVKVIKMIKTTLRLFFVLAFFIVLTLFFPTSWTITNYKN